MDEQIDNSYVLEADCGSENEYKKMVVEKQINKLYDTVILNFRSGDLLVYNPNIINNLSRDKFFLWILENNEEIKNLFEN